MIQVFIILLLLAVGSLFVAAFFFDRILDLFDPSRVEKRKAARIEEREARKKKNTEDLLKQTNDRGGQVMETNRKRQIWDVDVQVSDLISWMIKYIIAGFIVGIVPYVVLFILFGMLGIIGSF